MTESEKLRQLEDRRRGAADGASVTITVEINAESEGFDDRTRRTVAENATQLGFDGHEFED